MSNCKVIALTNQKGGVGKTTTAVNLGVSLAKQGKTVLLVDADAQANLTMALGYTKTDNLPITLSDIMQDIIDGKSVDVQESILHTDEGVDLLPSCVELAGVETTLIDTKNRESVLKACISEVKKNYDYVLIDCMPALGMLTINGLAAADSVIIPNQPHYFSIKGLEQLLRSVSKVKRQINPNLRIDGILMTMVMPRTKITQTVISAVKNAYGRNIKIFDTMHTLVYNDDGSTYVKSYSSGNAKRKYLMTDNSGTHQVYCVESGIDFNTGNTYTSKSGQNSSYFKNLPTDAQFGVMMALMYGWHEGKSSPVAGTNADDYAYATQSIIWEYQQQLRTSPADLHSANGIPADMYYSSIKGRPAEKCYNWILSQMADHYTIPSFAARNQSKANTYTLKYNPDTQKYSLTIEDTNNTLSNIKFSASGISVSRSGNKYTFTSDKMITSPVTVSAQKQVNLNTDDMLIWGCVGKQTMISGASDPVYFYFKIDTETYGTGHIKKTSEDGVVSGIKFNISGNGVNKTVTTKADGTVDIQLIRVLAATSL